MEEQIIIKGRLEPKTNVLSKPEFYQETTMLCFIVPDTYKQALLSYYQEHGMKVSMELTIRPWPEDITTRAIKYFFAMRDALVLQTQGDITPDRKYKDHLYRSCVKELDIRKEGKVVDSLKDLDKRGLWAATELMRQHCLEEGADIRALIPHVDAVQQELKE